MLKQVGKTVENAIKSTYIQIRKPDLGCQRHHSMITK